MAARMLDLVKPALTRAARNLTGLREQNAGKILDKQCLICQYARLMNGHPSWDWPALVVSIRKQPAKCSAALQGCWIQSRQGVTKALRLEFPDGS